jgi:hypothetical protein
VTVNPTREKSKPRFDVQLFFDELRGSLDALQWRDIVNFTNMNRVYMRRQQVDRRFLAIPPRSLTFHSSFYHIDRNVRR